MGFEDTIAQLRKKNDFFSDQNPVFISRAPGRLDLMGGNDDYTGGLVFESTIKEATYAAAQLRDDSIVSLKNRTMAEAGSQGEWQIGLHDLADENHIRQVANKSSSLRWTAYVLGNLHYLIKKYPGKINKGICVYMDSTVPLNRGVSSSAAIEVAVMKASAAAYGIELSGVQLALACQWVENVIAGSACGIMDQIAVVSGKENYIMPLVCQPCNPEPLIRLPAELSIWGIDSGVSHQVAGIEYEAARAAAFMGYKIICDYENIPVSEETTNDILRYTDPVWNGYLANLSPSLYYEKYDRLLPLQTNGADYLKKYKLHTDPFTPLKDDVKYNVQANTRYAVEENHRVQLFSELSRGCSAISSQRAFMLMGELMYQSHFAYTQCGLGAKATDTIVNLCRNKGIKEGIYGAKITGGGAGGTVAILAGKDSGHVIREIVESYKETGMGNPYLFEGSSDGADAFGIRVIQ